MNEKLISLFEQKGINKRQLAKACGLKYTTVNELLNKKQNIDACSGRTLLKLAAYFEVSIEDLLDPVAILENVEGRYSGIDYIWHDNGTNMELHIEMEGETIIRPMERMYIPAENFKYAPIVAKMEIDMMLDELENKRIAKEYLDGKIFSKT